MRKCGFVAVLVFLAAGGCGSGDKPRFTEEELAKIPLVRRDGLPKVTGGFVLVVSGETITSDEVISPAVMEHLRPAAQLNDFERFKVQARPVLEQILVSKISSILLYNQAKKDIGEQVEEALERAADAEVKRFVARYGGDYAKAEQALKGMDWTSFKELQKKMILTQSYIARELPEDKPITYSELMEYYNEIKEKAFTTPAMLRIRLIDIEPAKLEVSDPNKSWLEEAKELADGLMGRLRQGEDFGELAKQYSHGYRASFGGLWEPVQPESLAKPYDALALAAEQIEAGQVAGPIEAGGHIFIMKVVDKRNKSVEPFEKVQKEVENRIMIERRIKAIDELEAKIAKQAAVGKKDAFIDFCLRKIYRISREGK